MYPLVRQPEIWINFKIPRHQYEYSLGALTDRLVEFAQSFKISLLYEPGNDEYIDFSLGPFLPSSTLDALGVGSIIAEDLDIMAEIHCANIGYNYDPNRKDEQNG